MNDGGGNVQDIDTLVTEAGVADAGLMKGHVPAAGRA